MDVDFKPKLQLRNDYNFKQGDSADSYRVMRRTIFQVFSDLKIDRIHYLDNYSNAPEVFINLIFKVFHMNSIRDSMLGVISEINQFALSENDDFRLTLAHLKYLNLCMNFMRNKTSSSFEEVRLHFSLNC